MKNRKTVKKFFRKVIMGLLMLCLVTGCNPNDKKSSRDLLLLAGVWLSEMAKPQTNGTAQVTMAIANSSENVTRITVTVSASGMATPMVQDLVKVGQTWQGVINEIPTGTGRIFIGKAYNAAGTLLYQGKATGVTITFNQITNIFILLQDLNPVAPFVNTVPIIDAFVASTNLVITSGPVNFNVTAHDPNPGDTLTYLWSATGGSFNNAIATNTVWSAPSIVGSYVITIKVIDNKGSSCMKSFVVDVKTDTGSASITTGFNTWPVVESIIASESYLVSGASTSLALVATDMDGDTLSYLWASSCGTFDNVATQNPIFTVSSSATAGDCALMVTLNDGRGGVNSGSLTIKVNAPMAFLLACTDISTLAANALPMVGDVCSSVAFTSGANTTITGNVTAIAAFTSGANTTVNGNVTAGSAYTSGRASRVIGNVTAGAAYTSGINSIVNGNVFAAGDVTLGAGSKVTGYVHSGTGVIVYGLGSTVGSVQ